MMTVQFLIGVATGLMAGLTIGLVSLASQAWLADRQARRALRQQPPSVVDTEWRVIDG